MTARLLAKLALVTLLLGFAATARAADASDASRQAAEPGTSQIGPAEQTEAPKKWEIWTLTYGWFAGVKGDTDVIVPVPPVGLDLSFGDAVSNLKFAFMGAAGARRDRLILFGDLTFIHLKFKEGIDIRDQDFLDGVIDSKTVEVTALAGYRVANEGPVKIDLLGGVRANFFKSSEKLSGPNRTAEGSVSQTWFDPLIAARADVPLGGKFGMSLYGDIGGFGIAADLTWQGSANVTYDFSPKYRAMVGWRYFKVDYDKGDFLYNAAQSGPMIGLRAVF